MKSYYIQWIYFVFREIFPIQIKTLYSKKLFIFRESFYVERKYSEKKCIFRENSEFKFHIVWDSRILVDIFDINKENRSNDERLRDLILQGLNQTKDLLKDQQVYSLKNLVD